MADESKISEPLPAATQAATPIAAAKPVIQPNVPPVAGVSAAVAKPATIQPEVVAKAIAAPAKSAETPDATPAAPIASKPVPATPIAAPTAKEPAKSPAPVASATVKPAQVQPEPVKPAKAKPATAKPVAARAPKTPAVAKTASPPAPVKSPVPAQSKAKPAPVVAAQPVSAKPVFTQPAFAKPDTAAKPRSFQETFAMTTPTFDFAAAFKTAFSDAQEKAKAAYEKSTVAMGDASEFAKGNVEAMVESSKILASGLQELTTELVAESREAFEALTAEVKTIASVKSPADFFKLQSELMRKQMDALMANGTKHSEAFLKLASDAAAPLSTRVSMAVEKVKTAG